MNLEIYPKKYTVFNLPLFKAGIVCDLDHAL